MRFIAFVALFVFVSSESAADTPSETSRIHESAIVIDAHSDFLDRSSIDGSGLDDDPQGAQTTLKKLETGQVDAQFFSVFVPPAYRDYGYAVRTLELINRMLVEVDLNRDRIEIATTATDIRRITNSGKIAALMGVEGGHSIENRLEHLRNYYRLGVRYMTLT
jgi:membrane dipeptidase